MPDFRERTKKSPRQSGGFSNAPGETRTPGPLIRSHTAPSKPEQPQDRASQAGPSTSYSLAQTKQNAAGSSDPRFTHTRGRCSACGLSMGGEVLAGLCGRCPDAKLRDFIDRVRGNRETNRVQKQISLL